MFDNVLEEKKSEYKVPVTTIKEILSHGNADSLEVAKVYDFEVIVKKDSYKVGDIVIYIPIDSVLPQWLVEKLFPPDSKIKPVKNRIRQIKIRQRYSQGMLIHPGDVAEKIHVNEKLLETDLAATLEVVKYEVGPASYQKDPIKRNKPKENPYFHKYGGIDNFKWYPDLFEEGEQVSITEKIHGSNIRAGYVPYAANNLWRKLLKFLGLAPAYEWAYGSNNVQLQQRLRYKGYYGEDVYGQVLKKHGVKEKLKPGEIIYGELYGDGIQKGYNYGCKPGEHKLVVFDLKIQHGTDAHFVGVDEFQAFCKERGFESVPELYRGPFNKNLAKELTKGDSVMVPSQKVREGVVIKSLEEKECSLGRKLLKVISEKYLEGDQSDFH